jgi:hypothetical protein
MLLRAQQGTPAVGTCLAPETPPLTLGETAPDAVIDRFLHRVLEALLADRTALTNLLCELVLSGSDGKPHFGVDFGAVAVRTPVLIATKSV